jgi:hypothetical protein
MLGGDPDNHMRPWEVSSDNCRWMTVIARCRVSSLSGVWGDRNVESAYSCVEVRAGTGDCGTGARGREKDASVVSV